LGWIDVVTLALVTNEAAPLLSNEVVKFVLIRESDGIVDFLLPLMTLALDYLFRLTLDLSVFVEKKNNTSSTLKFLLSRQMETSHRFLLRYLLQSIQILLAEVHLEEEKAKARSCIKVWM